MMLPPKQAGGRRRYSGTKGTHKRETHKKRQSMKLKLRTLFSVIRKGIHIKTVWFNKQ